MKFVFTKSQSHQFRARLYSIKPVKVLLLLGLMLNLNTLNAQIVKQPINTSVCVGGTASFSVEATNPTATYQWQYSPNSFGPWNNIDLSTPDFTHFDESALNVTGLAAYNNYHFRCIIFTGMFSSFSNMAKLNVGNTPSDISVAPQTVCEGTDVTLTATQVGTLTRYRLVLTSAYGPTWHGIQEIVGRNSGGVNQTLTCIGASSATYNNNPLNGDFRAPYAFDGNATSSTTIGVQWLTPEQGDGVTPIGSTLPNTNWQNFSTYNPFYTPEWIEWSSPTPLAVLDIYNGTTNSYFKDYYLLVSDDNGVTWSNLKQGTFSGTNRLNTINIEPTYTWYRDGIVIGTGKTHTINSIPALGASIYGNYYLVLNYGCSTRNVGVVVNVKSVIMGASTVCLGSTLPLKVTHSGGLLTLNPWSVTSGTGTANINAAGVLTPVTAGTVTVNYAGNGCSSTKQITVSTASTAPTSTTGGGNYCHGNVINLTSNGGTNGTGAVDIWYAATGQTAADPASCAETFVELWNRMDYQNSGGCYYLNNNTDYHVNNGILDVEAGNLAGGDPFIWMYPLPGNTTFDADIYKYVNVRYKVTNYQTTVPTLPARMSVLFTKHDPIDCGTTGAYTTASPSQYPFSESWMSGSSGRKDLVVDGQWHIISMPYTSVANWNGDITGLRLDYFDPSPHNANNGSKMEVDFITVSKHPMIAQGASLTLSPGDVNYPKVTTTYYTKKIDNCGVTSCETATVVLPPIGRNLATNTQNATCNIKAGEKVHFYHSSGNFIASVNATSGVLGITTATAYVESSAPLVPACNTSNPAYSTSVMQRHWVITPTNQNPATVWLPFYNAELANLQAAANSNANVNDNVSSILNVKLSKYHGPSNVNNIFTDNCIANGGNEGTILVNRFRSGAIVIPSPHSFLDTVPLASYISYKISNFSEMWLHGSVSSPLPVTLTDFSATCNNQVSLSWTTASEQNSDRFVVEKSRDGKSWNLVGEQAAAGSSNTVRNYSFVDENSWNATSYYRLRQLDFNGAEEVYGPISISCENTESSMSVYPNPNNGSFTIEISSTEIYNNAQLFITDLTGKTIASQTVNVTNGTSQVLINDWDLKMGAYLINIDLKGKQAIGMKPIKILVTN